MVNIKELLDLTSQSCNTRERALGSLPANRALNSDQVISGASATAPVQRAPGPGLKLQAIEESVPYTDVIEAQASSFKPQAQKASSHKRQAPSSKRQASSHKRQAP